MLPECKKGKENFSPFLFFIVKKYIFSSPFFSPVFLFISIAVVCAYLFRITGITLRETYFRVFLMQVCCIAAVFVSGISLMRKANVTLARPAVRMLIPGVLFLALPFISFAWTQWPRLTAEAAFLNTFPLLFFLLLIVRPGSEENRMTLICTLFAAGVVCAAVEVGLYLYHYPKAFLNYTDAPLLSFPGENINVYSGILLIPFAMSAAAAVCGLKKRDTMVTVTGAVCAAVVALAILFSKSRSGSLGMAAAVFVLLLVEFPEYRKRLIGAAALIIIGLVCALVFSESLRQRLYDAIIYSTFSVRWYGIQAALGMAADRPLIGFGSGTYAAYFFDYVKPESMLSPGGADFCVHPHSEYFLVLMETGIVGLAAFMSLIVLVIGTGVRKLQRTTLEHRKYLIGLISGFTAVCIHITVTASFRISVFSGIFWITAGTIAVFPTADAQKPRILFRSVLFRFIGMMLVALSVWSLIQFVIPELRCQRQLVKGLRLLKAGKEQEAMKYVEPGLGLRFSCTTKVCAISEIARCENELRNPDQVIRLYGKLKEDAPYIPVSMYILSRAYYAKGNIRTAWTYADQAVRNARFRANMRIWRADLMLEILGNQWIRAVSVGWAGECAASAACTGCACPILMLNGVMLSDNYPGQYDKPIHESALAVRIREESMPADHDASLSTVYHLHAGLLAEAGQYRQALAFCKKALDSLENPAQAPDILMTTGKIYQRTGNQNLANECFRRAAQLRTSGKAADSRQ